MDCKTEIENRVEWIKKVLADSGAQGVVYGNSGGKDCTLVGALCKLACDNVIGVIMPCQSAQNYGSDRDDAIAAGRHFGIEQAEIDLTQTKNEIVDALSKGGYPLDVASGGRERDAAININPRLRMTALYAIAQTRGCLVAGTGNLDELTMGYFTKWGDGGYDFNPIADLTVAEVYELLEELGAPQSIIKKAPSAGLYPGQTDEAELGVTYGEVDAYLKGQEVSDGAKAVIERAKRRSEHKRRLPLRYGEQI